MKEQDKNKDTEREKFEPQGTKISPSMAVVWDAVCNALGTDTYHLLQQFIYSMIRAASDQHNLTPEIRQLLDMLDLDTGWQNAINLCAPNGKFQIAQMILIIEQPGKTGFGAVMLDKPFMGDARQTENVDQIYERLTEVIYKRHYMRLRQMGNEMGVKSVRQLIDTMMEAQALLNLDDAANEGPQMGDRTDSGRIANAYGKRTKRKHHRSPDSMKGNQQTIRFTGEDRQLADEDVKRGNYSDKDEPDFRPFSQEW